MATTNNLISIILILAFTALYSTTGGLRSVIATDTVQFGVAMLGTLVYAVVVVHVETGTSSVMSLQPLPLLISKSFSRTTLSSPASML